MNFNLNMNRFVIALLLGLINCIGLNAQPDRWQQAANYKMDIDFNIKKHQLSGQQTLEYTNNSPDTLDKVYYHLYFNAFKPGSDMDVRSRSIIDPDPRVRDRIVKLQKDEQGFQNIRSIKMNGKKVDSYKTEGTILIVDLKEPILPHSTVVFDMEFLAQIPQQIRRTGRFNSEGIEYSVSQWYPKMCNYDYQGWHTDQYIGREFYGIWGSFDVKITLPSNYIVAGTGLLQNKDEIGYGYSDNEPESRPKRLTWHFKADKVHDFVWAADPDYKQIAHTMKDGTVLRFFYQPGPKTTDNWTKLPPIMEEVFNFANKHFGPYPFSQYSFIQGGDGGMEYPMATLITGERKFGSLVGVSVHELMHSWYQMVLGSNELLYAWMDEGFTEYASSEVMNHLKNVGLLDGNAVMDPHIASVNNYIEFTKTGLEEPLSTHADHFNTNRAYGMAAYVKGEVFLEQLRYIIGDDAFNRGMLRYYNTWKFKHPNPNDFIRIMEKESGIQLDWFLRYFVNTTYTIDYEVVEMRGKEVILRRNGGIPMPIDLTVILKSGEVKRYYIPLDLMLGVKSEDNTFNGFTASSPWHWVHESFSIPINEHPSEINHIQIDVSNRMADVDRTNNIWPRPMKAKEIYK